MKLKNEISMIPFGLLAGFADTKEIRLTVVAENGFQFRVAQELEVVKSFQVCFYDDMLAEYHEVLVREFRMKKEQQEKFYSTYTVFTKQEDFKKEVQNLSVRYSHYIRLKLEKDDGELTKEMTGYPAENDEIFAENIQQQKKEWFQHVPVEKLGRVLAEASEFALELDRPELYGRFLKKDISAFMSDYWEENGFQECLADIVPDRLYIGNQFCHLLFPEEKLLFQIMEKAVQERLRLTLVFTYIREEMLKTTENLLEKVDKWCKEQNTSVEVVVNDWAMPEILRNYQEYLKPCLGVLLNKRRKDPRMSYKKGNHALYMKNNIQAEIYRFYLEKNCNIQRYEWESVGAVQVFTGKKNSLHIPFYQTNTSQYCPLYAVCIEGKRGKQKLVEKCPHFCENNTLLYPKHLNMVGRYNSLFGVDMKILKCPEKIKEYEVQGIDRLVLGL